MRGDRASPPPPPPPQEQQEEGRGQNRRICGRLFRGGTAGQWIFIYIYRREETAASEALYCAGFVRFGGVDSFSVVPPVVPVVLLFCAQPSLGDWRVFFDGGATTGFIYRY